MADSSGYINAYIDTTMGMLHENLSTILQLKTQAKLSTELVKARGEEFSKLQEELEKVKAELNSSRSDLQGKLDSTRTELEKTKTVDNEHINNALADAKKWEEECNILRNKVSVVDTLSSQFNDIKQQYKKASEELNSVKEENAKLQGVVSELKEVKKLLEKYENQNVKRSSPPAPKKNINTKNIVPPVVKPEEKADDF